MSTNLSNLSEEEQKELFKLLDARDKRVQYNKIDLMFPDTGPYRKEFYPKHLEFMYAGDQYSQRAFIAANRVGKTLTVCTEATYHATGRYPKGWKGKIFKTAIKVWACGISHAMVKSTLQYELLGPEHDFGSGLIPKDCLVGKPRMKPGQSAAVEVQYVRHQSGGISEIHFMAYEQGRDKFQGQKVDFIIMDEEPADPNIYTECLTRTQDKFNPGHIVCSFTPLNGLSEVVLSFCPGGLFPVNGVSDENPYKYVVRAGWDDVPHINEDWKKQALASYSEFERDARSKGMPGLGNCAVYAFKDDFLMVEPFEIPKNWPRAYGFDCGTNNNAAIWFAKNPDTGVLYGYREYWAKREYPCIHAAHLKSPHPWIPGVIDYGALSVSPTDMRSLMQIYIDEGLNLIPAKKSVVANIAIVTDLMASGRVKFFSNLQRFWMEKRIYRYEEKNHRLEILKQNDHMMDAMQYILVLFDQVAVHHPDLDKIYDWGGTGSASGAGRSSITGY